VRADLRRPMLAIVPMIALVGWFGCEQRFSDNPPLLGPESFPSGSSSTSLEALFAPSPDAGALVHDIFHAMTVTLCSSLAPCGASEGDASVGMRYHVVFGSGRGEIRSRGQAMADLYEELRNRLSAGERLNAEPHAPGRSGATGPGDAGRIPALGGGSGPEANTGSSDPIARCAFHLIKLVEDAGEVDLDVVHGSGSNRCLVSVGYSAPSSGASECLLQEPERPRPPGRKGFSF
jgi:hypothetical protein